MESLGQRGGWALSGRSAGLPLLAMGALAATVTVEGLVHSETGLGKVAVLTASAPVVLLVLPAVVALWRMSLRPRARAGSLLARADGRTGWCAVSAVAFGAALLTLPYRSHCDTVWWLGGVALTTLGACMVSNARDLQRARQACGEEVSLQPIHPGQVSPSARLLDVGVGERMLGEVTSGTSGYRAGEQVSSAVFGDPALGVSRLAQAQQRLFGGFFGAVLAASYVVGVVLPSPPPTVELAPWMQRR